MDRNAEDWLDAGSLSVALRKESVDRNFNAMQIVIVVMNVALRKESVDRNTPTASRRKTTDVALRKESVDRNLMQRRLKKPCTMSLSARRAWIEMLLINVEVSSHTKSLSARRAWIEITPLPRPPRSGAGRSPQGERG